MAPNVVLVHDEKSVIGEGPHWDQEAQVLYYVDLLESAIIKYDPNSKKVTRVILDKEKQLFVGFVIPITGTKDKFVIGYGKKFAILTWDGVSQDPTSIEILVDVDPGTDNLINDGKTDAKGRLWAGTMYHYTPGGPEKRVGTLYSLGKDGKTANGHVTDVGISNGLAWSSDNKTFYYIDSLNFAIDAFDYDIDGGRLSNRRTVFDLKKNNLKGLPDGMTIDKEDKLWIAAFGASAVYQIDPKTGSVLQTVQFPASKITSVAWGGRSLDELYVTSGNFGETEENSYAGRLFKITGLGTSGLPGVPVKL